MATNGMIYIGGDFEIYNGINKSAVASFDPDTFKLIRKSLPAETRPGDGRE